MPNASPNDVFRTHALRRKPYLIIFVLFDAQKREKLLKSMSAEEAERVLMEEAAASEEVCAPLAFLPDSDKDSLECSFACFITSLLQAILSPYIALTNFFGSPYLVIYEVLEDSFCFVRKVATKFKASAILSHSCLASSSRSSLMGKIPWWTMPTVTSATQLMVCSLACPLCSLIRVLIVACVCEAAILLCHLYSIVRLQFASAHV